MHPVLVAERGLECLDDAQGYANPGTTMLDRLGPRVQTNWDANPSQDLGGQNKALGTSSRRAQIDL